MADSVAITLLRHGLTEANERKAYLGWTNSPLSESGIRGVHLLKDSCPDFTHVHASDLERCRETARLLFPNQQAICHPEFREMNFGRWEGKTYDELKEDPHYQRWLDHPMEAPIPEGESYPEFSLRIQEGWQKWLAGEEDTEVLVTHGGVIRELLVRYAPLSKPFWDWKIPHATGYRLIWEKRDSLRRGERCTLLQAVPTMERPIG